MAPHSRKLSRSREKEVLQTLLYEQISESDIPENVFLRYLDGFLLSMHHLKVGLELKCVGNWPRNQAKTVQNLVRYFFHAALGEIKFLKISDSYGCNFVRVPRGM